MKGAIEHLSHSSNGAMDILAELVGESSAIEGLRQSIRRLLGRSHGARRLPSILIQGETGTGKGLVARLIHRAGPRSGQPFVDVNCAAIPEPLLEAELFGFERGAFTDARRSKAGLFQTAHRGTIFLDEVGLLPETLQSKLLKVIEEQAVRRLGSTASESIDTSVVSATNADLQTAIRERRFREDLYHRLAVLTLRLPPLRERGRDVVLLAEGFLARVCADYGLPDKSLAPGARARLQEYAWPGNIRELFNAVERVALLSEGVVVTADMLALPESPTAPAPPSPVASFDDAMREHVLATLEQTRWNISRSAALLGISRNTLRARIGRLGLRAEPGSARPRPPQRVGEAAPRPSPAPPAATPSTIRWEPRRLTLMRATLIRSADEALSDTSRGLEMLVDKVESFGGRIEEMSPRGIGAVFGVEPAEDATRRAAHAATAIQKAVERADQQEGERFAVKIGIHVGQVLVGQAGSSIEIEADAKRTEWAVLEAMLVSAVAGAIVVSRAAAPFLERRFRLQPAGEPTAPVYALGARGRAGGAPEGRRVAFVGRRQELDLLRSRLESVRTGHGQIVGIVGEAGIGKSRLLYEFRQSLRGERITYLEGHCLSYGAGMPYLPALELLRHGCRLSDTDTPESMSIKLTATLARLGIEVPRALPYLLQFLGVKGDTDELAMISPDAIQTRTFDILREMCLAASHQRPLVIAVEDMHWIDTASEALAGTVESLAGVPLLLILTYRPGYRPPWADRSHMTQIALQPLSAQDSLSIVSELLSPQRAAAPLARMIVDKAEGNPFFLEELARAADQEPDQGATLAAPDTIQEVLLARINRLSPEARRLLQTASVLGRAAPRTVLALMWDDGADLERPLRELSGQELLYERPSGDDSGYTFKHLLVQEVAYSSLLDARRRALHAAAGGALEALYEGRRHEVLELLAHHFQSSDDADRAVDYSLLAAEKSHRRWANAEALAHFDAALMRLDAMPDTAANRLRRIDAVVKQAEVKFALGRHAEHIQALEGIRDLVDSSADPGRRAAWHYWTGFLHSLTGSRPEVAIGYCREASAIAVAGGFEEIRAFAECCLAHAYEVAGQLREALAAGERALAIFESHANVWWACRTLWILNTAALYLGEWDRSLEYCRRALRHGEAVNDLRLRVVALTRIGSTHIQRGDPATGLKYCEEALALSPTPFDTAMVRIPHGYALAKTGSAAAGIAELAESVDWFAGARLSFSHAMAALRLSEIHLLQGEPARARELLEGALRTSRELGYRHFEGVAERLLGESYLPDDLPRAAAHLETATRVLGEIGAQNELAKALVNEAELHRARGARPEARSRLERALRIFESLGTLNEPARVGAVLAAL
ncbi:MAG TPA: sigma 54-interacting transcriptional regulator [Methylomirabilota bacterium]|nr:sigma 54-interacting transcriptional regulator [Methylomirabilota bacterium]